MGPIDRRRNNLGSAATTLTGGCASPDARGGGELEGRTDDLETVPSRPVLVGAGERVAPALVVEPPVPSNSREDEDGGRGVDDMPSLLLNRAEEGICVCHAVSEFPYVRFSIWNDRMTEITGYTMEEINRLGWYQSLYRDPAVRERAIRRMQSMREGQDIQKEEWEVTRSDGKLRTLRITTSVVRSYDNKVHVLGLMYDVTEQKSVKAALETRDSILDAVHLFSERFLSSPGDLGNLHVLLARLGEAARVSQIVLFERARGDPGVLLRVRDRWSGAASRSQTFGELRLAPGDLVRWAVQLGERRIVCSDVIELPACVRRQLVPDTSLSVLAVPVFAGDDWWGVLWVDDARPASRWSSVEQHAFEVSGGIIGAALLQARTFAVAERARHDAERANRQKDLFLATLSHELRNPLAPIRNGLYILAHAPPGSDQARRAHEIMDRQVKHLTRIVDDLLEVTRIHRGLIELKRAPLELSELVASTAEDYRSLFVAANVQLEVSPAPKQIWVNGDRTRLAQVVGNLLQNAVKFTPSGGKTSLSVAADSLSERATIRVADTGRGIAPDVLPHVFEPFIQADTTLDRAKGGLGLGLALVKGLVETHGGSVSAASAGVGKGATFAISLPIQEARVVPNLGAARSGVMRRRVLVIEDNVDVAQTLRDVLELGGHLVGVALSGSEGITKARSFHPDVVFCDIGLPEMDGYAIARVMRADPELAHVTLVALTGYGRPEDVARTREAGFDAHLVKPPAIEAIEELVARAPVHTSAELPSGEAPAPSI